MRVEQYRQCKPARQRTYLLAAWVRDKNYWWRCQKKIQKIHFSLTDEAVILLLTRHSAEKHPGYVRKIQKIHSITRQKNILYLAKVVCGPASQRVNRVFGLHYGSLSMQIVYHYFTHASQLQQKLSPPLISNKLPLVETSTFASRWLWKC